MSQRSFVLYLAVMSELRVKHSYVIFAILYVRAEGEYICRQEMALVNKVQSECISALQCVSGIISKPSR